MREEKAAAAVGQFIAEHPRKCIAIGLAISFFFSSGLIHLRLESDIRSSFSPQHSDSTREMNAYLEFYNLSVFPQRTFIHFSAVEGGDLLAEEAIHEIQRVDRVVRSRLEQRLNHDGLRSCHPLCNINAPFDYFVAQLQAQREGKAADRIFDHPNSRFDGKDVFIGTHLFQVQRNESATEMRISRVSSIVLWYFSRADTPERMADYRNLSLSMFNQSISQNDSMLLRYDMFGDMIANSEMIRGALEATTMMSIGFGLLVAFVCLVLVRDWPMRQVPLLTASALMTPLLGTSASFGLLCWIGYPVYSIQCVAPFLVLGIGVDDAFILFHWWQSCSSENNLRSRSRLVFSHISASITITSATNIVAFGIGFFTPTPQMSIFCLATALALLFDYLLTYAILGPVVFLLSSSYVKAPVIEAEDASNEKMNPCESLPLSRRLLLHYSNFASSLSGQLSCLALVSALFVFCTIGVFRMRASFEPAKAFPSDSPLAASLDLIKPVFNETFPLSIFVHRPPRISNSTEHTQFYRMVSALESINGVYGRERTLLFLKEYEAFDHGITSLTRQLFFAEDSEYSPSYHNLPHFLALIDNPITIQYERDTNDSRGEPRVSRFQMAVVARGMSEWARRAEMVDTARRVLQSFPEFNATLFDGDSAILHLLLSVGTDLVGSILVTVLSMAVVCSFFVQSAHAVLIITSIIASICYCLVGVLSWWGADLDPVTQVDVLLATGFSVDYTAHIAFHFCRAAGSARERIASALQEMSAPLLQAGISTLLCMLPLIFVRTYAILAFAKTVFSVVFLGLLHGLFILPVLLSILPPRSIR